MPDKITNSQRILLISANKHMGNLLISLGLIQALQVHCQRRAKELLMVLDDSYGDILQAARLPSQQLVYYPRQRLSQGNRLTARLATYLRLVHKIRSFNADLAVDIEGDSVSSLLTRLSGAGYRLGPIGAKHGQRYHQIVTQCPQAHIWYHYASIFNELGISGQQADYGELAVTSFTKPQLKAYGIHQPFIAIHAGATKAYKQWPISYFVQLMQAIQPLGYQAVLIGAGKIDRHTNQQIQAQCSAQALDLSDRLTIAELMRLYLNCSLMVGNDSGPMHLASALGRPVIALFGPTKEPVWRPLGSYSRVLTGQQPCDSSCRRRDCPYHYRCLTSLKPERVIAELKQMLG
jgi:heptosyltransferase-3